MKFKKEIILSYFFQAGNVIIAFLTTIILTKMLTQSDWGNYSLFQNLGLMTSIIGGLSLPSAVIYFVASSKIDTVKVLFNFSVFQLIISVVTILSIFFINNYVSHDLLNLKINNYYYLIFIYVLLLMVNNILVSVMRGEFMFNHVNIIIFISNLLLLSFYIFYYFFEKFTSVSINTAVVLLLVNTGLQFFLNLSFLFKKLQFKKLGFSALNRNEIKEIFKFVITVYIANVVQIFVYKIDAWILYKYVGSGITGIYTLAVTVSQTTWLFATAVSTILFSLISQTGSNGINNTVSLYLRLSLYATLFLGFSLTVAVYFLSDLIFGVQYRAIIYIIPILLIGIIPFSIVIIFGSYVAGINRNKLNLISSSISFFIVIILDLILIPKYQYWGAAAATVIAYLSSCLYCIMVLKLKYNIHFNSYINPIFLYNDVKKILKLN